MQPLRRVRWGWELRLPLWGAISSHSHQTGNRVTPRSVGVLLNGLPGIFVHVASSTALSRSVPGGALCLLLLRLRCHPTSICSAGAVLVFVLLLLRLAWSLSSFLEFAAFVLCPLDFSRVEEAPTRNLKPYRHTPKTTRSGAIFIATFCRGFASFGGMFFFFQDKADSPASQNRCYARFFTLFRLGLWGMR